MKRAFISFALVAMVAVGGYAMAENQNQKQAKGWAGTDVSLYGLNEYGVMVELVSDYVPARFPQSIVRTLDLGTPVFHSAEMDAWVSPSGTGIWIVLYSDGLSHCATLIGDFGF